MAQDKDLDDIRDDLLEAADRLEGFDGVLADCLTWCDGGIRAIEMGRTEEVRERLEAISAALEKMR